LSALDEEVHDLELAELEQETLRDGYKEHLKKIIGQNADYQVEIDDYDIEQKILEERIADLQIKDLGTLQQRFKDIYQSGPPATKYLRENIFRMLALLKQIGDVWEKKPGTDVLDVATNLNPEYKGYLDKLTELDRNLNP
jgi:hypothetical protein